MFVDEYYCACILLLIKEKRGKMTGKRMRKREGRPRGGKGEDRGNDGSKMAAKYSLDCLQDE